MTQVLHINFFLPCINVLICYIRNKKMLTSSNRAMSVCRNTEVVSWGLNFENIRQTFCDFSPKSSLWSDTPIVWLLITRYWELRNKVGIVSRRSSVQQLLKLKMCLEVDLTHYDGASHNCTFIFIKIYYIHYIISYISCHVMFYHIIQYYNIVSCNIYIYILKLPLFLPNFRDTNW